MNEPNSSVAESDNTVSAPDQAHWQEQKSALKWPMIVLFGLPMVALAVGILLMVLAAKMAKPDQAGVATLAGSVSNLDKDTEIARLQAKINRLESGVATPSSVPATTNGASASVVAVNQDDLANLNARVERLEQQQKDTARAVAVVYAAQRLAEASRGSAPFVSELSTLDQVLGSDPRLAPLKPLAQKGVPSQVGLTLSFPLAAAKANAAAPIKGETSGLVAKITQGLRSIISIRRVDQADTQDVASVLRRAEMAVNQGKLDDALVYLAALPSESQAAMAPWLEAAKARLLIDQTTKSVTDGALNRLSHSSLPLQGAMP